MFAFQTMNRPALRSSGEKFEVQARMAALQLEMEYDKIEMFLQDIISKVKNTKDSENLNGAALALLYNYCFDISLKRLSRPSIELLFKKIKNPTGLLKKFIDTYRITTSDLIRYIRFYQNLS
jgi:hypothetical protein